MSVYHRTHYEKPEDFKLGFKVGGGAYHGAGLYTTQELKDQMGSSMIETYGPIIVEFEVTNTGKFIYFDLELARKIMTGKSLEEKRNDLVKKFRIESSEGIIKSYKDYLKLSKDNSDLQNKELNDELKKLAISKEDYKSYGLISQLKRILGGTFSKVYQCSKKALDELDDQLYKIQEGQRNANIANAVVRLPGILANIDGIVYTGFVDGNCVLIYDPKLAVATKWALVPDEATYSAGIKWNLITRNLNRDSERSHIFTSEKSGILFNQGKVGDKVEIRNARTSRMVKANIIGRIPSEKKWDKFTLGITSDLAQQLGSQEEESLLVIWRGLKNVQDKVLNQMNLSPEFISGLNLMKALKEKGDSYKKLSQLFIVFPDQILSSLKLELFAKNRDNNRDIIKDFIKDNLDRQKNLTSYNTISPTLLEFLSEDENKDILDVCKNKLLTFKFNRYDIKSIFIDKDSQLYEAFHQNFSEEELKSLLINNVKENFISCFDEIFDNKLLDEKIVCDLIFENDGKPIQNLFNNLYTEYYIKKILAILFKHKTQESVFELLKKNKMIFREELLNAFFGKDVQSTIKENILIEYLKEVRNYLKPVESNISSQINPILQSDLESIIVQSDNPIIKKYKKSILKQKYIDFFDNSDIENNFKVINFISIFYNSPGTLDLIKKWFSTGKVKIEKNKYKYTNYFIGNLFRGLESISDKKNSEDFIKELLEYLFNIRELRLNFLAKDPMQLFNLSKEKKLYESYENLSEDLEKRRRNLEKAKHKRETEIIAKNHQDAKNRKEEVLQVIKSSQTFTELIKLLDEKRLIVDPDMWTQMMTMDFLSAGNLYTRSLNEKELDRFNKTVDSLREEIIVYIKEGKIQSKYTKAKDITEVVELYAKELSRIKPALNTLTYKFKNLLHKII